MLLSSQHAMLLCTGESNSSCGHSSPTDKANVEVWNTFFQASSLCPLIPSQSSHQAITDKHPGMSDMYLKMIDLMQPHASRSHPELRGFAPIFNQETEDQDFWSGLPINTMFFLHLKLKRIRYQVWIGVCGSTEEQSRERILILYCSLQEDNETKFKEFV